MRFGSQCEQTIVLISHYAADDYSQTSEIGLLFYFTQLQNCYPRPAFFEHTLLVSVIISLTQVAFTQAQ